ncbi:MAG: carboxypeptidase-like regulatory domain-containing protein [Bacteroidia bacterium]|nr:carboxypeptidase-like regulatory domain-containing protein [Bacteroidia bacterium]
MLVILLLESILLPGQATYAQQKFTLSGTIRDASNGETLIGATVYVKDQETGSTSNTYGFYSLTLPAGTYALMYSYVGYTSQEIAVQLTQDQTLDIPLSEGGTQMEEIVILGEDVDQNVSSTDMGVNKLEIQTIRKIPDPPPPPPPEKNDVGRGRRDPKYSNHARGEYGRGRGYRI